MSWPDLLAAWAGDPGPLRDYLSRGGEAGFCADCLEGGKPCPDHDHDYEAGD